MTDGIWLNAWQPSPIQASEQGWPCYYRGQAVGRFGTTLSLSRRSLDFFKREARKRQVPYQRMIRALVDTYAGRQATGRLK
jgi:hypothetical protein